MFLLHFFRETLTCVILKNIVFYIQVLRKLTGGTRILTTMVVITMITTDTPMAMNMATDPEDLETDMVIETLHRISIPNYITRCHLYVQ